MISERTQVATQVFISVTGEDDRAVCIRVAPKNQWGYFPIADARRNQRWRGIGDGLSSVWGQHKPHGELPWTSGPMGEMQPGSIAAGPWRGKCDPERG